MPAEAIKNRLIAGLVKEFLENDFMSNKQTDGLTMRLWLVLVRTMPVLCAALWIFIMPAHALESGVTSSAQKAEKTPLFLCVDPDWWPFEAIDEHGKHVGIASGLIELVISRANLPVTLYKTKNWEESVAASVAGKCQLVSFINQTPEREKWLIFTEPLLIDPNVLITREDMPALGDLTALKGYSIAIPKASAIYERVQKDFPNLKLIGTDSEYEAFSMVSNRKADMTLRSRIVAGQNIKEKGWFNLKIANEVPGYENRLRMGVLKSEPALRDILNVGIAGLTRADREKAINRYVEIKAITDVKVDYTLVIWLAVVLVTVIVTSLWWMRRLHQLNACLKQLSVTDALTGLTNRTGLYASFPLELARAQRYERPLSVILLDLDHFKSVNDEFGHLVGDKVLVEFATLIQAASRKIDAVYRWGGEEFLIICQETRPDQVRQFAERILESVRNHLFTTNKPMTVSAGIAALCAGDTMNSLIQRADEALYQAKKAGRNQIQEASELSLTLGAEDKTNPVFVQLVWKAAYESGNLVIDKQHQMLFTHANNLLTTILTGKTTAEVGVNISALIDEVVRHFKDEETILVSAEYVEFEQHVLSHRKLVERALELVAQFHGGNLDVGQLFQFLANDVVAHHMLVEDRKFFSVLPKDKLEQCLESN